MAKLERQKELAIARLRVVSSQNHAADCWAKAREEIEAGRLESANKLKMQAQEYVKHEDEYEKEAARCMTTLLCNDNRRMQGIQSASESEGKERNQNNMLMGKKE